MITKTKIDYTNTRDIGRQIGHWCRSLLAQPMAVEYPSLAVERIRVLLESVPLASDDYNLTVSRVSNARRYLNSNETGAARYEIRLLLGLLRQLLGADCLDDSERPPESNQGNRVVSTTPKPLMGTRQIYSLAEFPNE